VRVDCIVVLKPAVELAQDARCVGSQIDPCVIAFECLYEGLGDAVGLWASIGVVHGTRPISWASARVLCAV